MTPLSKLLENYRQTSKTEREKGTYFEELIVTYFKNEPTYKDLYSNIWLYSDWAAEKGLDARDTGIDLVAKTDATNEYHAIQCKCYAEDYRIQKSDIDSFFTASGKKPFTHRLIVTTTTNWSIHAEESMADQHIPVSKIDLNDLENSLIDWSKYESNKAPILTKKFAPRPHQKTAIDNVIREFKKADRGKLIMACGTGKTFTSLRLAEQQTGKGKRVLFLVPSLSLLSQTLTEWTQQSEIPLHSFAVCSDSDVGKKKDKNEDDVVHTFVHELRYPATTQADKLAKEFELRHDNEHMSVVYSTYHSIAVISKAQKEHGLADFDLIICDEAHRTTGATFSDDDESAFVRVHDQNFIRAEKRLYMTATPRLYGNSAKANAEKDNVVLCSMDDPTLYGHDLHTITFSEAVRRDLLCDYKVIVLTVDEAHISRRIQSLLKDENNELKVDDAAKIIGCWKALSKLDTRVDLADDDMPMKKAVAFCQVIEPQSTSKRKSTKHKVSSKNIAAVFQSVVEAYQEASDIDDGLFCEAEHVDGSMNASEKSEKINWLKEKTDDNVCRILSNVRCLSEGVDVPALDAVLFLTPRNSQVDVVQSVGRVMRKSEGKTRGYVILPVVVPTGMEPDEALNDNQVFKVVWDVLQALRSHDDRFDAMINKLDLIGKAPSKMEVISITDKISPKQKAKSKKQAGKGDFLIGSERKGRAKQKYGEHNAEQAGFDFQVTEVERALYAQVVKKCGNRKHWEQWANDIAKIADTHIIRIKTIVENPENVKEAQAFNNFVEELRDDLNEAISPSEVIEMLAQHLITKPVFDALFKDHSFATNNPVSLAMQEVLDLLHEHRLDKEADTLEQFYASVEMRAEGIDDASAKQKIIVELYDKFFRNAFPKMTERLGIVYTPVEVVDFIIHSVNDLLQKEFGQTLGSKGVHILDPFTGTGTFITRLLQSGLISKEQLQHKYKNEIHANEIVLLAYYIAAINIEAVYHSLVGKQDETGDLTHYEPFNGICLTDTFQLYEKDDLIQERLSDNSQRRIRQKNLDNIQVIIGNPPYSAGQTSANDNNANLSYEKLDAGIRETYAAHSTATNKNALYDSYIRAIRWASDRIENKGIVGFVTNAGFLEGNTADGVRKCLAEEYSNLYVFHLRGNQRTSGELSRKEGGKIFGSGSRAPIAITLLVKKPESKEKGKIYWHDIGDYLTQQQKLDIVSEFVSVNGISKESKWTEIVPDKYHDWVNQRDDSFYEHVVVGTKEKGSKEDFIFKNYSRGIETARDAWCYNASKKKLASNMEKMASFYNDEVFRYSEILPKNLKSFVNNDPTKISWSSSLLPKVGKGVVARYSEQNIIKSYYRPFNKQWLYHDGMFNHRVGQMPNIFPNALAKNKLIYLSGSGNSGKKLTALMLDGLPDLNLQHSGGQGFPLYLYEASDNGKLERVDAIHNNVVTNFQKFYANEKIDSESIFYYIYGVLHSTDYHDRFEENLTKTLPRIPFVKTENDFWLFSRAGRDLADLHLNYETVDCYPVTLDTGGKSIKEFDNEDYYVTKMKYSKNGKEKDQTTIIYNNQITIKNIPVEAYEYVVNGKPALDWVIERQCVSTDKNSQITNDANDWAVETMGNAKYPLELFKRVITVSLETMKIVKSLPKLDI
ncbi:type ISP restriction/modification enzyme [uncultured Paraglaciecola sp.]|uniref:DEAD/DEAH box helicase n=1 Tax=uncultured Paraglaciecola sp. TaxID=1765024 RepID=UPI0030D7CE36|tara:strand:+ start:73577 stop:78475 length:4899 start_codon:yes stop_codon:yes gene_type:complete